MLSSFSEEAFKYLAKNLAERGETQDEDNPLNKFRKNFTEKVTVAKTKKSLPFDD
jgi:hypothetical protein